LGFLFFTTIPGRCCVLSNIQISNQIEGNGTQIEIENHMI
jgi:hypothetical protein